MAGAALVIGVEALAGIRLEAARLAMEHFAEVDAGVAPHRPHDPDWEEMERIEAAGAMLVYGARIEEKLVGYLTWQLMDDLESKGLPIALQGAWFVVPKHPLVAWKLFLWSMNDLKARGVKLLFPHHRTQGRGAGLGKFFTRLGAKHIQQTYSLWIGD